MQANQLGVRLVLWAGIVPAPVRSVVGDREAGNRAQRRRRGVVSAHAAGGNRAGWSSIFCAVRSFWWGSRVVIGVLMG